MACDGGRGETKGCRDGRRVGWQGAPTSKRDDQWEEGVVLSVTEVGCILPFLEKVMPLAVFYWAEAERSRVENWLPREHE